MKIIFRKTVLLLSCFTAIAYHQVQAEDLNITGVWNLVSLKAQEVKSKISYPAFGQRPIGQLVYTAEGYMNVVFTSSGRTPLSEAGVDKSVEAAKLFETMTAYAGTYKVSGQIVTHHVNVAGDPSWVGSDQVRKARIEGDKLVLRSTPTVGRDGREYEVELVWGRAK